MDTVIGTFGGLVIFVAALVALDLAALRWGADSRHPDIGRQLFERHWKESP
jgi:hypothetical protein